MSRGMILFLALVAPILALGLALLGIATFLRNIMGWVLLLVGVAFTAGPLLYIISVHADLIGAPGTE